MKNRIIWKFLGAYAFLIFIAILVLNFFVSLNLRDYYELKITEKLASNSFLIGDILAKDLLNNEQEAIQQKSNYFANELNLRITVMDSEGRILVDSEENPGQMENHLDRPEVIRAIKQGIGESNRFSDTLGYNMKYVAISLKDNDDLEGFVRLALPLTEVESQIRVIYRIVLLGGFVTMFIALIIGYFVSRSITEPISEMKDVAQRIAKGDFTKKISSSSKDELGVLAKSLNTMAEELQTKIESLNRTDKIRTEFIANVSHELKTPLTSIKGFIETLEDGAMDDKKNAKKFIEIIKKHAERLSNIVDDLLNLSELELGKDRVKIERFDLKSLVNEVALGFGHAFSAKKQELKLNFRGNDFSISADKVRIEQILVNLIDNATKYTNDGGTVIVSVVEQNNHLIVNVEDNGVGISQKYLPRIFERFYRIDKSRSRQLGGTGLGLAIVKHIASLHNAKVDIKSEVNKGTQISISIPKIYAS